MAGSGVLEEKTLFRERLTVKQVVQNTKGRKRALYRSSEWPHTICVNPVGFDTFALEIEGVGQGDSPASRVYDINLKPD